MQQTNKANAYCTRASQLVMLCMVFLCSVTELTRQLQASELPAATERNAANMTADNIVIVLDASGSMSANMNGTQICKMDAAKTALSEAMAQIPTGTQVGLLVFSSAYAKNEWYYPLEALNRPKLLEVVKRPQPSGGTPLGEYIKKAADALLSQRQKQYGYGTYRLLIVTDGEANDSHLVDAYVPEAIRRGLRIDVIGVDMLATHTLAKKVHSYRKANDPQSLKKAVSEIFAEVGGNTGGGDQTGVKAFSEVAALPDQTASALLAALSEPTNTPLGQSSATAARSSGGQTQTLATSGQQTAIINIKHPTDNVPYVAYAVIAIVCISIFRGVASRRSGR